MALRKCKECGKDVSTKAKSCPNCGAIVKKQTSCLTYFVVIILAIIIIKMIAGSSSTQPSSSYNSGTTKPQAGYKVPDYGNHFVTYDKYNKIENGMSYSHVVKILGYEGEELSRSKFDGVPGVTESITTIMYQWVNDNGSNMNAMFQNDKLVNKAQFGLK